MKSGNTKDFGIIWKNIFYPLLLVLLVLVVLYPFSAMLHMPKWDSVNGYLPYRYFISYYLENDQPPLWNPFQRLGYPGYSDLQSGCWYPVTRLIMLFGQYDVTSLNVELLSCFVIAALGMYRLSLHVHICRKTAFLTGFAYSLSGFMIGSTQLMVFLIGVAWLPWIIWSVLSFFRNYQKKYALYTAVFVAMNITGASPVYTILIVYILTGMLFYHLIQVKFERSLLRQLWRSMWPSAMLFMVLLGPYVISFIDFAPYFNRLEKRPYEEMIMNPFVAADYLSFLFPYAVNDVKCEAFHLTDLTLRNAYLGFSMFVALVLVIWNYRRRTPYFLPLLVCSSLALILAMGDETFIYKYVFRLPGFGVFRHPSFFRSYAILCLILLAGFRLRDFFAGIRLTKTERFIVGVVVVLFAGLTIYAGMNTTTLLVQKAIEEVLISAEITSTGVHTLMFLNGVVLLTLFMIALILLRMFKLPVFIVFLFFVFSDHAVQVRLTGPTTMYYTFSYAKMKEYFLSLPDEIDQRYNTLPMKYLNDKYGVRGTDGIWVNVSTFNKTISWEGENPLRFRDYDIARNNGVLERNLENPILFFPSQIWDVGDTLSPGYIWNTPEEIHIDTSLVNISQVRVGFNEFGAEVKNGATFPQWLVLNQNYHHLWKARLDEQELTVNRVNDMLCAVILPAKAEGKVLFTFTSPFLSIFLWLWIAAWIGIMLFIFYDVNRFLKQA